MTFWIRAAAAALAIALPPSMASAQGGECRVKGDLTAQVERCSQAIADADSERDRAIAYLYRCQAHDMMRQHDKALADCLASAELGDDPSVYNSLNIVYRNLGRYPESVTAANKAIELNPDKGAHFAGRAASYCRMGEYDSSLADRLKAVELGYLDAGQVQQFLKGRGFYDGAVDGQMGEATEAALRAWTNAGC